MKKLAGRTVSVLLLVAVILAGMALFFVRLIANGDDWAASRVNGSVYSGGKLTLGAVTDREGEVLVRFTDSGTEYSADPTLREAVLHTTGDRDGNIAFTAPKLFSKELVGYDPVSGVYSATGDGGEVRLSLSAELCKAAYEALDGRNGTVAVMNYDTGEILCMVSSPSFDPVVGSELQQDDSSGVYINRFLSATYVPGSVYKLVTLAAAIETIPDIDDRIFSCTGTWSVGNGEVVCTRAHGDLTIDDALAVSCNCTFAQLAVELGGDTMEHWADRLGLTESFTIDGAPTAAGRYDSASEGTIELAWSGVGQYNDMVNPAAMLRLVSAIANGGTAKEMTLLKSGGGSKETLLSAETASRIAGMMDYCVHLTYGEENFPGLELAAKSGTAELGGQLRPHSWFVGFSDREDIPLSFVVIIENGGWGSVEAGNVAKTVLSKACDIFTGGSNEK